jgi:hypothetical protein
VPGGQDAGGDPALHGEGELEQPDGVGDGRPATPDTGGQLVVGDRELLKQLLVGRRLLEGVQLDAVDVLQQRVPQHRLVGGLPDDRRDLAQLRTLGGPQPALAHDQLVAVPTQLPHHDGLHEPELADGVLQLGERVLVEDLTRLFRVGLDRFGRDLAVHRPGDRATGLGRCRWRRRGWCLPGPGRWRRQLDRRATTVRRSLGNQCRQTPPEATLALNHVAALYSGSYPRSAISRAASR